MRKLNQKGSAVLIVLVAILVVAVGGVGYYVYHSQKGKTNVSSYDSKTTSPDSSNQTVSTDYLEIKEWGVRMKKSDAVKDVSYTLSGDSIKFSSGLESQIPTECGGGKGSFSVIRDTKDQLEYPENAYTKIGDNYYRFVYPQIGCDADKTGVTKSLNDAYKSMFDSIQVS